MGGITLKSVRHEEMPREKLLQDVLIEIRLEHKLKRCPFCGSVLTESTCAMGMRIFHQPDGRREDEYRNCNACGIIWHLSLHNWSGPDWGHQLYLDGLYNCFCHCSVFGHYLVTVEDQKGHHSVLGVPCPDADEKN